MPNRICLSARTRAKAALLPAQMRREILEEEPMSFADSFLFCFNVLAGTVFICQLAYFSVLGLRITLKDRKIGTDVRQDDEAYWALLRKQP
jgi:hypothetical protein